MSTHNLWFEQKYEKYQNFLSENFCFLAVKFSVYLNKYVFIMSGSKLFAIPPSGLLFGQGKYVIKWSKLFDIYHRFCDTESNLSDFM